MSTVAPVRHRYSPLEPVSVRTKSFRTVPPTLAAKRRCKLSTLIPKALCLLLATVVNDCRKFAAALVALLLLAPLANAQDRCFHLPFTDQNGIILVTLKVNDRPTTLLLDTGATYSAFSKGGLVEIEVAEHQVFAIHAKETADFAVNNRKVFAQLGITGILGEDFLHKFKSVRIDYANHVLELEAR